MNLYNHIFDIDTISKALSGTKTVWLNTTNGEVLKALPEGEKEGSHLFKITPIGINMTPQTAYDTALTWLDERDLIPPSMKNVCAGSLAKGLK